MQQRKCTIKFTTSSKTTALFGRNKTTVQK